MTDHLISNPYLLPGRGKVAVTLHVTYTNGGGDLFVRWVNPLDYDFEHRLVGALAHEALTWRGVPVPSRHGGFIPAPEDEALGLMREAADWNPDFAWAEIDVNGEGIFAGPACGALADLEYDVEHPESDRHVDVRSTV